MNSVKWYQKKEFWGLLTVIGSVLTVIPGTQLIGVAVTAGAGAGLTAFGVKDGIANGTSSKIVQKFFNK